MRAPGDALFDRQGLAVMLHLALKAFYPAKPPFPLLHVDTTWKFRAMYEMRERMARESGHGADRPPEPRSQGAGHQPLRPRPAAHRHVEDRGAEAGARQVRLRRGLRRRPARRGEVPRQGADLLASARPSTAGTPRTSGPELWRLYNTRKNQGESIRAFPISNWTELDIWQYIHLEDIPIVPLYFADERPVVERDGTLIMVDDERMPALPGESPADALDPLPHPGLLSADRRGRERRPRRCRRSSRRCCSPPPPSARAGSIDHDQARLDGEEEAGGLLLMPAET